MKFCLEPDFFIIQVLLLRCQKNILVDIYIFGYIILLKKRQTGLKNGI